jgi:hypothetical protein
MTQANPGAQNTFNISAHSITNLAGSGSIHYDEASREANATPQGLNSSTTSPSGLKTESLTRTILILSANPRGTMPLRLDEEVREISEGLKRANKRDQFILESRWAVQPRGIQRAMLDLKPHIVHFSGHGEGEEGLLLEDETGQAKFVDAEALAGLFELFADRIECVVLNACYSEVQARAIARHIPSVIGMSKAIGDRAAIDFAVGFYDALGAGESVDFAYKLGCIAMRMAGIPEHLTPRLERKPA